MIIDPKSTVPIFRQIADQLRQSIERGSYRPGEMLPSLRALAIDIKVNPNTVQRAYDALEREGIVETRRGIGIFVVKSRGSRRSEAERKLAMRLFRVILAGAKLGMTPDAIRVQFESAMRQWMDKTKA